MKRILPVLLIGGLLSASSALVLAQDPSYGVTMPDSEGASGLGLSPNGIGNPYIPQTWYDPKLNPLMPQFAAPATRYVGPNEPAHPEDYAQ